jgi:threonyl-tRNA synthetase
MSTIQLDFAAKERFDLTFIDETGGENSNLFVIHRAPLSTHERFIAFLTEHWAGNFPTWLSPIQAQVITISEKQNEYGGKVAETLEKAGVRTKTDFSDNTIGKKIRVHRKMRPAYMLIIGEEESKKKTVAIRNRAGKQRNDVALNDFVKEILEEIKNRCAELKIVPS